MKEKIEVITGPTASGKTALALKRFEDDNTIEIVNADASLLYKGFDIGTAKPRREIRNIIPHHIIDILDPSVRFNAKEFSTLARNIIRDIIARGKRPLVVGGTGFYIDALFFGISTFQADEEKLDEARIKVAGMMKEFGFDLMLVKLKDIDQAMFDQISRERNPRRLERAFEFYYAAGFPLGEARKEKPEPFEFEPSFTVIEVERDELRQRIAERINTMIFEGWLREVENLLVNGVTEIMPAMNAIGYKQLAAVNRGEVKLDDAREDIIIRTRQYAKRQVTWMKQYLKK